MQTISKQMIEQAQAGNQEAFSALYQATYGRNYYVALKMVKREADTEDILQDAYVKIFHNLKKFTYTGENSFASWTTKIVSNTALDFLRRKSPVLFSDMGDDDDEAVFDIEDTSVENRPDLSLDQKETSRIVQELLDELSDEQRICIIMYYVEQLSVAEIAEQCECSEGTIKSRLRYARIKLQGQGERLEREGIHIKHITPLALLLFLLQQEAAQAADKAVPILKLAAILADGMTGSATADAIESMAAVAKGTGLAARNISKKLMVLLVAGGIFIGATGSYIVQGISRGNGQRNTKPVVAPTVSPEATVSATDAPEGDDGIAATAAPEELPTGIPDDEATGTPDATAPEETVSKPDKEPVRNSTPKPSEKVAKKPTKKPTEKVSKQPAAKPTPKASEKPEKKPAAKATKKPAKATKKPAKKATPKPAKKSEDNPDWDDDYVDWDE